MSRRGRVARLALEAWPALAICTGFIVPFVLLLQVSVSHREPQGLWSPGFEFTSFAALIDRTVFVRLVYTIGLALLVAALSVGLAFPMTYFVTRMRRHAQVVWLILFMSTLSLSEVLVAFAWQIMLARRIGLSDLFVALGLLAEPQSLSPSLGAVFAGLVYLVTPIAVILLFPSVSKLDRDLGEAARTMGATPLQVMVTVTLPLMRGPLVSAFILAAVFTIGTYVTPMVLGHPAEWTFAILIGQAALSDANLPFAATMSLLLLAATLTLTGITVVIGRRSRVPA